MGHCDSYSLHTNFSIAADSVFLGTIVLFMRTETKMTVHGCTEYHLTQVFNVNVKVGIMS